MTPEEFGKFIDRAESDYLRNAEWRRGQAYFNRLRDDYPDIAVAVLEADLAGADVDPFHRDVAIPNFLHWIADNFVKGNA